MVWWMVWWGEVFFFGVFNVVLDCLVWFGLVWFGLFFVLFCFVFLLIFSFYRKFWRKGSLVNGS